MLIGVLADTHVGEVLPALPDEVRRHFASCDLIIHAGDLTDLSVVRDLEQIAPVVAVLGDHDRDADVDLPARRTVEVEGHRIGVVHGRRPRPVEVLAALVSVVRGKLTTLGLHRSLQRSFGSVDAVVYGHLHVAQISRRGSTLFMNPGGVYTLESDPGFRPGGPRSWAFRRAVSNCPPEATQASVGFIRARVGHPLEAWVIPLRDPIRAETAA